MASRSTDMTLTFNPDVGMRTSELDYELPSELIAQRPLERRDESRLLVFDRANGAIEHRRFRDLRSLVASATLVVVNDTRVLPARLTPDFRRSTVALVPWHGSGDLAANARANCYAVLPEGREVHSGDVITVLLR